MIRKVISSTITVTLISMTPAGVPARYIAAFLYLLCLFDGWDVRQEHEAEREVDEVHRLDKTDDGEEPRDHASLCFGLAGDAADEGIACKAVANGGADGAQAHGETECDQCAGENESVICH